VSIRNELDADVQRMFDLHILAVDQGIKCCYLFIILLMCLITNLSHAFDVIVWVPDNAAAEKMLMHQSFSD